MSEQPLLRADASAMISLEPETNYAPNGIVSRTLLATPSVRLVLFGFDAGQELTEHTSPHHALVQVLSGGCDFTVDGVVHAMQAGDLLHMAPGAPHAVRARERFSMLLTLGRTAKP
ncbi:MAG: cupin domain-containing protein [Verrucomicrobiae bacterium]|nr:cupin domain-containing protein [Verrucomicrobiae bacterium]MCP5519799.1 cupin domain-containing protein [Verrucomicrobiales bacterium]MCP5527833.1 cupin domain-containing protein [Verrucomicrobiales bacterium]